MSAASRQLQPGARVVTDFSGRLTVHTIVAREEGRISQSGILFRVAPRIPGGSGDPVDADWFEPWSKA